MSGYVAEFSAISNSDTLTTVVTLSSDVPVGDSLVASIVTVNSAAPIFYTDAVDSSDNKWRFLRSTQITGTDTVTTLMYAYVARALQSGDTITFSHNNTQADRVAISVAQYNDALTADVGAEGDNGGVASTTLVTSATATTTDANELVVGAFGLLVASRTFTATNSFTSLTKVATTAGSENRAIAPEYKYVASTGTFTANGTLDLSSEYAGIVQTFRLVAPADTRTAKAKAWSGSAWEEHDSKVWNGSAWNEHKVKARVSGTWIGPLASNGATVQYDSYDKVTVAGAIHTGNTRFTSVSASAPATALGIAGLHGSAISFAVDGTSNFCSASFPFLATATRLYIRTYFRVSNYPSANTGLMTIRNSGGTALANLQVSTTGKLRVRNGATLVATSTNSIGTNVWVRIEWYYDNVAGAQTVRLFLNGNEEGTTADETLGSVAAVVGTPNRVTVGIVDATTNLTYEYDEFAVDGDKWVESK